MAEYGVSSSQLIRITRSPLSGRMAKARHVHVSVASTHEHHIGGLAVHLIRAILVSFCGNPGRERWPDRGAGYQLGGPIVSGWPDDEHPAGAERVPV